MVLVVLDALNAAHLGCYGDTGRLTPNLDRLAARGLVFERAFSNSTWTLPSTTSLFTGQLQETHGVVTARHSVPTDAVLLPELFRSAGWRTAAFVQMAQASATYGFDRGFDEFRYYGSSGESRWDALPEDALAWLRAHTGERYFAYLHLRRPHGVYDPFPRELARLEGGCRLVAGERDEELSRAGSFGERALDPHAKKHVAHLYRANLASVDLSLGDIIDFVEADTGALVIVTSDHGEALGEHDYYGHGDQLYAESVDIPLILAGAGVRLGTDRTPVSTIDLFPTLSELCGLDHSNRTALDGVSLVGRVASDAAPVVQRAIPFSARYRAKGLVSVGLVQDGLTVVLTPDGIRTRGPDARGSETDIADLTRLARDFRRRHADLGARPAEPVEIPPEIQADLDLLGCEGEE